MIFVLSVISIPLIGFLLIQNNDVQNYLAGGIANKLSKTFGTKVSIGKVSMDLLNRLIISNLCVEDLKKDTLLYSSKTTISVRAFSLSKKTIKIERIELTDAQINFKIDTTKTLNLQFIISKLAGDTLKTKKGWDISFNNIELVESNFSLINEKRMRVDTGINFNDLNLSHLNIRLKNLSTEDHITSFRINRLSFSEKSGFYLKDLSSRVKLNKGFMHFDNLRLFTQLTTIDAPKIYFDFGKFKDFSDFARKVKMRISINNSSCSLIDLGYFAKVFYGMKEDFKLSGNVKGPLNELRCKNMSISYRKSSFSGDLSFTGLPVFKETYMFIDSRKLKILVSDVEHTYFPKLPDKKINLPVVLKKIGSVNYKGKFIGFINDFVSYGSLITDLGEIKTDFSLKPESKTKIAFNGKLTALNFNVGKFVDKEKLIGVANIHLDGTGFIEDNKKVTGAFIGKINQFDFNNYYFTDIQFNGSLKENAFDGSFNLDDPNIKLNLLGHFDLSKKVPEFDFTARLKNARLPQLRLVKKDSVLDVSCDMNAKFKGNNINNSEGNILINNIDIIRGNKSLSVNTISFHSSYKNLQVTSDIADVNIDGAFEIKSLVPSLVKAFKIYAPSSFSRIKNEKTKKDNHFTFNINLKNPKPILDFFAPGKSIAENTILSGIYFPSDSNISLSVKSAFLAAGKTKIEGLDINCTANHDSLFSLITTNKVSVGDNIKFQKFQAISKTKRDSVNTLISWSISDSSDVLSKMNFNASFTKDSPSSVPYLKIKLLPTEVSIIDSIWSFRESEMRIDSSSISIINMKVAHKDQELTIKGRISENKEDTMKFTFSDFDLTNIGFLINSGKFKFDGMLKGKADLIDFYHNAQISAHLKVDSFTFNNVLLGNTTVEAKWDNAQQKVIVNADSYKKDIHSLEIKGYYTPSSKIFDFTSDLEEVNLSVLQPFLSNIFVIKSGTGSGRVFLKGAGNKPVLSGDVLVKDGNLLIYYLNTSYKLNALIKIDKNKFLFPNIQLKDQNNNYCYLNGIIKTTYFKDFNVNLTIDLDNTMVLNTRQVNNTSYYGKVFASGKVSITGLAPDIFIEVTQARTEKNSFLYIPIDNKSDLIDTRILTFKEKETLIDNSTKNVNLQNIVKSSLKLKMDFEITPDAEVQLLFDPKIGDIIKSSGTGNLVVEVNPVSGFSMRGDYTIKTGDYLFTLQNLINKRFILQEGGLISWNGNPMDASIDLKAVYGPKKASVYNLFLKEAGVSTKEGKESDQYKKRIPVECVIYLTGKLMNPNIKPEIVLPNATEETRDKVREAINNEEELNKQFFMLLVTNSFYSDASNDVQGTSNTAIGRELATTTSIEMLSNQFSNWVSQISKDFDLSFNYRPGERSSTGQQDISQEVEVALSTQIFDDWVSINGNLDVGGTNQTTTKNTNKLVGDVNVDVKLTESGNLMLKAFNRSNERVIEDNPYTQGVGLVYREEFINLAELTKRYYQKLFGRKNEKPKVPAKNDKNASIEK